MERERESERPVSYRKRVRGRRRTKEREEDLNGGKRGEKKYLITKEGNTGWQEKGGFIKAKGSDADLMITDEIMSDEKRNNNKKTAYTTITTTRHTQEHTHTHTYIHTYNKYLINPSIKHTNIIKRSSANET